MAGFSETNLIKAKQGILFFFVLIMLLPLFQLMLPFTKETPLNGVDQPPPLPEFATNT